MVCIDILESIKVYLRDRLELYCEVLVVPLDNKDEGISLILRGGSCEAVELGGVVRDIVSVQVLAKSKSYKKALGAVSDICFCLEKAGNGEIVSLGQEFGFQSCQIAMNPSFGYMENGGCFIYSGLLNMRIERW